MYRWRNLYATVDQGRKVLEWHKVTRINQSTIGQQLTGNPASALAPIIACPSTLGQVSIHIFFETDIYCS